MLKLKLELKLKFISSFHDDIILRRLLQLFSQVFLHSQSLCFSKIITRQLKSTMETLSLTFLGNILVDRQC